MTNYPAIPAATRPDSRVCKATRGLENLSVVHHAEQFSHGLDPHPTLAPSKLIFLFSDDGSVSALRFNDWKINFTEQRAHGANVWSESYVSMRLSMMQQLRMDPFERA